FAAVAAAGCECGFGRARGFIAFFHRGFARKFHAAFVVDADALDPDLIAVAHDVLRFVHAQVSELTDVNEAFLAGHDFDKRAELFRADDAALIDFADLNLLEHAGDDLLRAVERVAAIRVNVDGAAVLDVDLRAGLGGDAFDRLAARADEHPDFVDRDL